MVKRGSGNNLPGKRNPLIYQGNNYMNAKEILEKSHYKSIEEIDKDRIDWNRKLLINLMDDTEFRMKVVEDYKIVKSGNYRKEFYIPDWAYKLADVIECGTKEYSLEYGTAAIEIHTDALRKGDKVLIVDDLLASGGTAKATGSVVKKLKGEIIGYAFLIILDDLNGVDILSPTPVFNILEY